MQVRRFVKKGLLSSLLLGASFASLEALAIPEFCFEPYVGVGIFTTQMKGGRGVSTQIPDRKPFYPKEYQGGAAFLGFKFHEYLGLEFGYESTKNKKKTVVMDGQTVYLGVPSPAGTRVTTNIALQTLYLDLQGTLPIWKQLSLIGSIGVAKKIPKIFVSQISEPAPGFTDIHALLVSTPNKNVLRLGIGGQYEFCENIGVRLKATFEKTSKIQAFPLNQFNRTPFPGVYNAFRDSTTISFSLFAKF